MAENYRIINRYDDLDLSDKQTVIHFLNEYLDRTLETYEYYDFMTYYRKFYFDGIHLYYFALKIGQALRNNNQLKAKEIPVTEQKKPLQTKTLKAA